MSKRVATAPGNDRADRDLERPIASASSIQSWPTVALILLAIIVLSLFTHARYHNSDVSWLITVAEKVLEGKILYRDILETNPPGAVLLYMPATYLGKLTGHLPEDLLTIQTYLLGLFSLLLAYRMLPDRMVGVSGVGKPFLMLGAFNLFVLPMDAFAQREHFATMLALPMVASFVCFAETGTWPAAAWRGISLLMAAMMLAIKPYFVLPGLFVAIYAVIHARSWRPLWQGGLLSAALLGILLTASSLWAFPHYLTDMWPLLRQIYFPARSDFIVLLLTERALIAAILALLLSIVLVAAKGISPSIVITLCVSSGFLLGYFIQGKGFPYHAYPALFFALASYAFLSARQIIKMPSDKVSLRFATPIVHLLAATIIATLAASGQFPARPPMKNIGWAERLSRPSIMMISKDPEVSFPLVRMISGNWVDPSSGQWISFYTKFMALRDRTDPSRLAMLDEYHRTSIKAVIATLQTTKPEILLVDIAPYLDWMRWELFAACPGLLKSYRPIAIAEWILVMQRKESAVYGCGL